MAKKFGLLGQTLGHSFSPQIHARLGDYEYGLYEKTAEELPDFLEKGDFQGLNVTIPYKKAVIPFCCELSPLARQIGSVNTLIRLPGGGLRGDNTDYFGLNYALDAGFGEMAANLAEKKVLVLGSGGAAATAAAVLKDKKGSAVRMISRTGPDHYGNLKRHRDAEFIVNTTPVGMYPENGHQPVQLGDFPQCRGVLDLIYNPDKTRLLLEAQARGMNTANGLVMLVAQAARASQLFTGNPVAGGKIEEITAHIRRQTLNLVLIGMPGSGKSTVAGELATLLGRPLIDIDQMIQEKTGSDIPGLFAVHGEDYFRDWETACLAEAGRLSGQVIATGGGCVVRPANRALIRQNGRVIFLKRDLALLAKEGRPLSLAGSLEEMAAVRLPLYEAWADLTVDDGDAKKIAKKIKEAFGL